MTHLIGHFKVKKIINNKSYLNKNSL